MVGRFESSTNMFSLLHHDLSKEISHVVVTVLTSRLAHVTEMFPLFGCRWTRPELASAIREFSEGEQRDIMLQALDESKMTPSYKKSFYPSSRIVFEALVLKFTGNVIICMYVYICMLAKRAASDCLNKLRSCFSRQWYLHRNH